LGRCTYRCSALAKVELHLRSHFTVFCVRYWMPGAEVAVTT